MLFGDTILRDKGKVSRHSESLHCIERVYRFAVYILDLC